MGTDRLIIRTKEYLFFEVFSHEKPQKWAKNGEKQLKHSNFETYHGFHGNLFNVSVGKMPKTAKTCSKWKTNDLFAFYCDSIKQGGIRAFGTALALLVTNA